MHQHSTIEAAVTESNDQAIQNSASLDEAVKTIEGWSKHSPSAD
jgi:hypothetical protein